MQEELESGSLLSNLQASLRDDCVSIVQRESIINEGGQLTPIDEIRRTQSEKMQVEEMAYSMGEKNPLLERRGTIGYAFSQENPIGQDESHDKTNARS